MGFSSRDAIRNETAFDPYRGDARYRDIVENAGKPVVRGRKVSGSITE
jgi:hypothetical protein